MNVSFKLVVRIKAILSPAATGQNYVISYASSFALVVLGSSPHGLANQGYHLGYYFTLLYRYIFVDLRKPYTSNNKYSSTLF